MWSYFELLDKLFMNNVNEETMNEYMKAFSCLQYFDKQVIKQSDYHKISSQIRHLKFYWTMRFFSAVLKYAY